MRVQRLTDRHHEAVERLLLQDPLVNLFLIGYLRSVPIGRAWWYGAVDGDEVLGLILVVPGRLMVPWCPDPGVAAEIGAFLRKRHRPCMVVGPREASDAAWETWARGVHVDRWHDQRLYVCDRPLPGDPVPGFRRATLADWEMVARHAIAMEFEDLGRRAYDEDPAGYLALVRRRIELGQTWVIEDAGRVVFQINVGTVTDHGVQVGGTYVPKDLRGRGIARAGMTELGRRLLREHPTVTLHVNEANTPAVRVYEACGYRPHSPYRLITVRSER